jgi:hypothetical protein
VPKTLFIPLPIGLSVVRSCSHGEQSAHRDSERVGRRVYVTEHPLDKWLFGACEDFALAGIISFRAAYLLPVFDRGKKRFKDAFRLFVAISLWALTIKHCSRELLA